MGGRDWFQALASAVGIPGVAGSDVGCDIRQEQGVQAWGAVRVRPRTAPGDRRTGVDPRDRIPL